MNDQPLTIEVCSRDEAGVILSSADLRADICFLISISDPESEPPDGYAQVTDKLRLLFSDTADGEGPTEEDVRQIIDVARSLGGRHGRVLIHCQAGISRSSAAAVILNAAILGPGQEVDAVRRVITQRPIAHPNRRMIALADRLLDRKGNLIRALSTVEASR